MRWSGAAGPSSAIAGACHAPHTTAMFSAPAFASARIDWRMYASRRSSPSSCSGNASRSAAIASVTASNAPSGRDSTTSSHQRSGSPWPATSASAASGSARSPRRGSSSRVAILFAAGRSMKRTGTSCSCAYRIARHSGEKRANG